MEILGEFIKQIVVAIFFIIIIIAAVRLGISMAKKKNEKEGNSEQN